MEEPTTNIIAFSDYKRSEEPERGEREREASQQGDAEQPLHQARKREEDEEDTAIEFFIREEALFRQNVQLDLAHEHIILYRATLVILWIGGMVLLRQWALALI